ncbi:hypothetical protein [Vibrio parahaemolyticus]|uniref:hypothetical protein n=1 Tax=Vibrio parahaemolyticus TaxID=670 RepID=UPI0004288D0B|nr:hypothetical protein [Vibrio parahaemolyticus]EGQ8495343.1 hypothetical protein [Vibrio alginolyticus]ANQ57185.1 hypothetical protein AB831_13825 [Vibrio parahaemolyticus]ASO17132.1 hypothetical protein BGM07_023475 [Vibrio parahaemolyticus]EGQ7714966.1 hypothetical protein [Vibrio parahaemolyticus]EGQ7720167.1 hypothetical protein [Vibrio parahaemolyticus]
MNDEEKMYMLIGQTLASCQALEMNARNYFAISKTVAKKKKEDRAASNGQPAYYDVSEYEKHMESNDSLSNFIMHFSSSIEGRTPEYDTYFREAVKSRNDFVHRFLANRIEQIQDKEKLYNVIEELIEIKSKVETVNTMIVEALEARLAKGFVN